DVLQELHTPPKRGEITHPVNHIVPSSTEIKTIAPATIVSSLIGTVIGIIPGTGGAIACFLCHNVSAKISPDGDQFGHGALSGVAAPEAANNATTGGALIPMMCLGVPGDVVTSVMLGALILIGVTPGPLMFKQQSDVVGSIFASMLVIQFLMLGFGLLCAKFGPYILKVPYKVLMPIIVVLCVVGSFSLNNATYDVLVALSFGILGYFMKRYGYPGAPLVLGVILGPIAEDNLNRAMITSHNSISILFQRPISCAFLILSVFSIAWPFISAKISSIRQLKKA
ncbi:MAG: tripartite tricarboxylate transporter permease, partial [Sphaerochaetaceae bacterium]|nr:tripartite tricarboxylate transporter permease [Sphaerochaetaceae bacterium]